MHRDRHETMQARPRHTPRCLRQASQHCVSQAVNVQAAIHSSLSACLKHDTGCSPVPCGEIPFTHLSSSAFIVEGVRTDMLNWEWVRVFYLLAQPGKIAVALRAVD